MRRFATGLLLTLGLSVAACAGDDVDESIYAVDTDDSGTVDCTDQDHVLACVHHEITECTHDDVNHDGTVDEADAHDIHAGLTATGHECEPPDAHE
jgi:hypothetical protein